MQRAFLTLLLAVGIMAAVARAQTAGTRPETTKWAVSGDVQLTLVQALPRTDNNGNPTRIDVQLFVTCARGTWGPKLNTVAWYNNGEHTPTLVSVDAKDPARVKLAFTLRIAEDQWVPAADASFTLEIDRRGEELRGTYKGTVNKEAVEGTLTGRFNGYTRRAESRPPLPRGNRGYVFTADGKYLEGAVSFDGKAVEVKPFAAGGPRTAPSTSVPLENVARAVLGAWDESPQRWEPPDPWRARDENSPQPCAEAWSAGTMELTSHARGPSGPAGESYQFVYQRVSGDLVAKLRVLAIDGPPGSSVGLMLRPRPDAGARFAFFEVLPHGDLRLTVRYADNGPVNVVPLNIAGSEQSPPVELRLPMTIRLERRRKGGLVAHVSRGSDEPAFLTRVDWSNFAADDRYAMGINGFLGVACVSGGETPAKALVDGFALQRDFGNPPVAPPRVLAAAAPPPEFLLRGTGLVDGTFLAGATAGEIGETFTLDGAARAAGLTLPAAELSRMNFDNFSAQFLAKVRPATRGVLLKSGDFAEGDLRSLRDKKATVSSVIFGRQTFNQPDLRAIVARVPPAPAKQWLVRLTDGSLVCTDTIKAAVAFDAGSRIARAPAGEVLSITRTGGTALADLPMSVSAPEAAEALPPQPFDPARGGTWDSGGSVAERPIVLASDSTATFDLGGRFATLALRLGINDLAAVQNCVKVGVFVDETCVWDVSKLCVNAPQARVIGVRGAGKVQIRAMAGESPHSPPVVISHGELVK